MLTAFREFLHVQISHNPIKIRSPTTRVRHDRLNFEEAAIRLTNDRLVSILVRKCVSKLERIEFMVDLPPEGDSNVILVRQKLTTNSSQLVHVYSCRKIAAVCRPRRNSSNGQIRRL